MLEYISYIRSIIYLNLLTLSVVLRAYRWWQNKNRAHDELEYKSEIENYFNLLKLLNKIYKLYKS